MVLQEFSEPKNEQDKKKEAFHMKRETLELVRNYVMAAAGRAAEVSGLVKSIAKSAAD